MIYLNDYQIRVALTFAPVWYAHAEYWPKNGDPIPRVFGRHPSAHGVSRTLYSRINAVYGLMLVTSVLKFFDVELYALAGAFCTGAQPMWMTAIETAGDLLPGWSAPSGVATVPVSGVLRRCCAGLTGDQASC
ncbi:hypothetical protein ACIHEJ_01700 [Streptomyces sp. NPDC052301]|uniref:hypothetical protein n=1 Tax=Streptomyces sp. NPDC052301 TaxID=3365687 RepID=UPI0037D2DFFA